MFKVFHRTWYIQTKFGREPEAGKKYFIGETYTEEMARNLCKEWNLNNDPGLLSNKAEYEEV